MNAWLHLFQVAGLSVIGFPTAALAVGVFKQLMSEGENE